MPKDFRDRGNISMVGLLEESGYLESSDKITEEALEDYFKENNELIEDWLLESMDTRSSPAWYFKSPTDHTRADNWTVGFYPDGDIYKFNEGYKACAFYVKRFLEKLVP